MRGLIPLAAVLAMWVGGCASHNAEPSIVGPVWIADSIAKAPVLAGSEITLKLDADGRSGGKAGCNTYGAGYRQEDTALTFEQAFSTKMFCSPDSLMAQEQAYLDLLGRIIGFSRTGEKLELFAGNGETIVFHVKP
jgi:putative lipoprotein